MPGPHVMSEPEIVGGFHEHPDVLAGKKLALSVVTPQGAVVARPVDEIAAPGELGELGVLPGHLPLLAALRPGVLSWRVGDRREFLAVGAGYVQVGAGERVRILVTRAESPAQIDVESARRDLEEALEALKAGPQGAELELVRERLDWANARLAAAQAR